MTGERELALISEEEEVQLGREADQEIVSTLGLYEDERWQNYVQELGERMALDSERPDLPWTFRVVDDPVVNAFALPGGYIYLTRGILAHFGSEAELAGVLGHEIGHVTARHSVQQISRAQLAQLGLGLGTLLLPELETWVGAAGVGLQLLLLSYSRDAEREADDLGLRYMADLNYDPTEMAATFETLARASEATAGSGLPGWLATHPDPDDRRARILAQVEEGVVSGERVEREAYLARLEGMVFGEDPRRGYFLNNTFYNPEFELQFSLPDGWEHARQGTVAQAVHPDRDAVVVVGTIDVESAEEGRAALTAGEGVSELERREASLNGLPALISEFQAETEGGPVRGVGAFVAHEGAVFQILGYARPEAWDRNEAVMRQSVESVSPIQDPERLDVEPRRIQLVRIDQAMSLEEFERRHPSVVPLDTLALMNGLEVDERLPAGTRVKRVTGPESP